MADENLSFQITFDEIEKLTQEVSRAGKSIESLGEFGREAGRGIDVAASSAVEAAEAILRIDSAARQAAAAVDELTTPREMAVDTSEIEDAFAASERLRAEIEEFAAPQAIAIDFTGLDEANRAFEESFSAAQNLRSEIEEFDAARTAVDSVKDSVDKLGDSLDNAASQADQSVGAIGGSFGKIASSIAGIAKAAGAAALGFAAFKSVEQIGQAIAGSMRTAVREFVEAEQATLSLTAALGSLGQFSHENAASIRAFADEIARTTTFEDDAVVSAAALIAQLGRLSGTELKGATQSAVQLSAVLGKDLQSAALLVARAAAGSTEALSRYRIVVNDSLPVSERFADIQRQIAERFGGRAQADLLTFGGSVQQLKKSWNELLESFGRSITVFQPAINLLTQALEKANKILGIDTPQNALDATQALDSVGDAIDKLGERRITNKSLEIADMISLAPGGAPLDLSAPLRNAMKELGDAEIAIRWNVEKGNIEELDVVRKKLALLREVADDAGQIEVVAGLDKLAAMIPVGPLFDQSTIDQANEATRGVQVLIDLLAQTQTIGGAQAIDLIRTDQLEADTTTVEDLGQRLVVATKAVEVAVGRAATTGGAVNPAGPALELFNAYKDAREKFLADFGTIPAAIEKIFRDGMDRAAAIARQFPALAAIPPVDFEIGIKIADPDAIGADIQRIVGDSLTRASQAKFQPIDVSAFQNIATTAEEARAKIDAIQASTINLTPAFGEVSASAAAFGAALASGLEAAFASMLDGTAKFRTVFVGIFKSLADEAIRQIARIAAATAILFIINPGAGLAAAFKRALGKTNLPQPDPVAVPIMPDTSGTRKAIDDLLGSIRPPTIEPVVASVDFQPPRIQAIDVPVNLAFPDLEPLTLDAALELQEIQLPDLDKLTVAVDFGEVPALEPQTVSIAADFDAAAFSRQIEAPRFDVGASFERPRFEASDSSTLAFSRFVRATQSIAEQRPSRRADEELRVQRIVPQINISATDGISVRRQLSAGALRRELERSFRRGR